MSRFDDVTAQAASLEEVGHRPWPLKRDPWLMGQTWQRLLFAHWRVPHDLLRPHVPESLTLEERDGSAWLGLTPFRVAGLRLRGAPPLPMLSSFCELNCRTYVRHGDRPGIWFFSLEPREGSGSFRAHYRAVGDAEPARPGTLEHFLVERYCLYAGDGELRAEIHHAPWALQPAEATVTVDGMAPVPLEGAPLCHYAERQDVVIWRPERVEG